MKHVFSVLLALVLLTGCGAQTKAPPVEPSTPALPSADEDLMGTNLRIAADAKLPVPTTVITTTVLPAPTAEEFAQQTKVQPEPEAIRRAVSERGWVLHVIDDRISLWMDERSTAGDAFVTYLAPSGGLKQEADLTDMVAQLQRALSERQVAATRQEVTIPRPGPTEYQTWSGALNLKEVVAQYQACTARLCTQWSRQLVPAYSTAVVISVPVDMLDLGNGVRLGFSGKSFITQSIKSGRIVTTWYELPGLQLVQWPSS